MVERNLMYSKSTWKKMVWSKGWRLEDIYWSIERQLRQSLDLLSNVNVGVRYITWWKIADKFPELKKKCEIMSKILCHSSILKSDDLRLKSLTRMHRLFNFCDVHAVEDARHFILHCTFFQSDRDKMLNEISNIHESVERAMRESRVEILYIVLGHPIENLSDRISIKCTQKNSKEKLGVGLLVSLVARLRRRQM